VFGVTSRAYKVCGPASKIFKEGGRALYPELLNPVHQADAYALPYAWPGALLHPASRD
jgi:hypothetical protein